MKKINGTRIFTLELNEHFLTEISAALMNHPFGRAAPIIAEITKQIEAQVTNKEE